MKTEMHLHSSKDNNYEIADKLGLTGEVARIFSYALCEVIFEVEIDDKTGLTTILTVNGRKLL